MIRGASGYATLTGPIGVNETDTYTCYHCNRVVHVHWVDMTSRRDLTRCPQCYQMICPTCAGKGCTPFEKKLEAQIRAMELYQAAKRNRDPV